MALSLAWNRGSRIQTNLGRIVGEYFEVATESRRQQARRRLDHQREVVSYVVIRVGRCRCVERGIWWRRERVLVDHLLHQVGILQELLVDLLASQAVYSADPILRKRG